MAGQFLVVLLHYPLSLNIMSIMLEYVEAKHYPIIWGLSMGGFTLGKMLAVSLDYAGLDQR